MKEIFVYDLIVLLLILFVKYIFFKFNGIVLIEFM